jgi:hypothetical protein
MGSFNLTGPPRIDQGIRPVRPRQQDTAFLKCFADRGDPETQGVGIEPLATGIKVAPRDNLLIALVDAAAWKHQRAGVKIDLIMAHHHENLDLIRAGCIAQQQNGGGGTRLDGLGHAINPPRWIAAAGSRACRPAPPETADSLLRILPSR